MEQAAPYFAKGFGLKSRVLDSISRDYHSGLVAYLASRGGELERGGVRVRLARDFGFCYGVDRTVQYAYEARLHFPDRPIYITGEIIHNPHVNQRLIDLGMEFLSGPYGGRKSVDELRAGDVVLLPAFGAPRAQVERLRERGCVVVDTTCGSVLNVWKNVERYAREGVTSVVHGKYWHEETRATCSQVLKHPGARYLVLRDMEEARIVCEYVRRGGDRAGFLARFGEAASTGFDPDLHLGRLGLANQTTMLSSESLAIGGEIRRALLERYGADRIEEHYRAFDTICSATQDRQDAMVSLVSGPLDLVVVVGGFNSSNTTHLAEIAAAGAPTYHIESADDLVSAAEIRHRDPHGGEVRRSTGWLPGGSFTAGFTSGASTPNADLGRAIARLFELRGVALNDLPLPEARLEPGGLPVVVPPPA